MILMAKKQNLYEGRSNEELYELAQICVDRCRTDLRAVERRTESMLDEIEELDVGRMVLRMSVRE